MKTISTILTKEHPQWGLFVMLLDIRLNYKESEQGKASWNCDTTLAGVREILGMMAMDVDKSIKYLEDHSGFCDCEVMMNVVQD